MAAPVTATDGNTKIDEAAYFGLYSHHYVHEEMMKDKVRTGAYRDAIANNADVFKDKVVLDVGCGMGILSMFAVKAGARHVVAVDNSPVIEQARIISGKNGMGDKITFLRGMMEDVVVPFPKIDIIISEWMGYCLLNESMLETVLYARDKYLVKDGLMFPDKANMYIAGIEDHQQRQDRIGWWDNVYGFDFSSVKPLALRRALVEVREAKAVVTDVNTILSIDLLTVQPKDLTFEAPFKLVAQRSETVHTLLVWFDNEFTAGARKPLLLSTGPSDTSTHWSQTVFFLENAVSMRKGEVLAGVWGCKPVHRRLSIDITYRLIGTEGADSQAEGSYTYQVEMVD